MKAQRKKAPSHPMVTLQSSTEKNLSKKTISIIIGILAFLLYANTLGHEYTVDDTTVIKNNKFTVQGFAGLDEIFTSSYRAGYWDRTEGLYRPISVAMFALEWAIAPEQPWLGHFMNVLLYALTAMALFSLMSVLLKNLHPFIPILVTLLWVFHPVHTEVVANIKSRDELLSFFFGILTIRYLMSYLNTQKRSTMLLSFLIFFLALLSKENSVTWAGVIPLAIWCFTSENLKKTISISAMYIGIVIVYLIIRQLILGDGGSDYQLMVVNNSMVDASTFASQFATAISILGKYLYLFILPVTLVFDYSYNTIPNVSFSNPNALFSLIVFAFGLIYSIRSLSQRSIAAFGILFFLGTISLVSNVFFLIEATMAERFIYTPTLGLCILVGVMTNSLLTKKNKKTETTLTTSTLTKNTVFIPSLVVLLLFAGRTYSRNQDWKSNYNLLTHDVEISPNSARIRYALGSTLLVEKALVAPEGSTERTNFVDRAIVELTKGVTILPNYNDAWYNLGIAYKEKKDAKNAIVCFEKARSYKAFTEASRFSSAGVAYGLDGQYEKALADLSTAVKLEPNEPDNWNNYGLYLSEAGKFEESLQALDKSISLKPDFEKAIYNKGNAYAKAGRYQEALREYQFALSINVNYTDALNNSGNCYVMLQKFDSALVYFQRSVDVDPNNAKAVMNLAVTLQNTGDTAKANIYFQKARSLGVAL
ncbi:MAG: tetratricopeptide repeat protein [Bacteroidetes bacterium]|nr:tetratricopeptide repeat protein [Bacteroidota bacterium]